MTFTLPLEHVPSRYRCFYCLHVRTGTVLLSVFQIVVHFVIIAILTAALGRSSHFRDEVEYAALSVSVMSFIQWERFSLSPDRLDSNDVGSSNAANDADKAVASTTMKPSPYTRTAKYFMNAGEEYVAIAVTLISLLFSIMMLIGTIYARPYYLLPYCCIQFLDLFVTCLSVVGYYTYMPENGAWSRPQVAVSLLVILAGVLLLALKAYLLAMVWLCYKFLIRYSAGLEPFTGFSLASGFCVFCVKLCERFGLIRTTTPAYPILQPTSGDRGSQSDPPAYRSPSGSRRLLVLFHRSNSRPMSGTILPRAESCLPPKYEDVLAMSSSPFDPPPYESIPELRQTINPSPVEASHAEARQEASNNSLIPPDGGSLISEILEPSEQSNKTSER